MARILLSIALTQMCPTSRFSCFPVKFSACNLASQEVTLKTLQRLHTSPSQYSKSLLNAETLPHYMQTGMQQHEPAQNIPYESHISSPNILAYDNVILSILKTLTEIYCCQKSITWHWTRTDSDHQRSNLHCSVKVMNCLKISIYIEREKK